jgi:hypothetical protein
MHYGANSGRTVSRATGFTYLVIFSCSPGNLARTVVWQHGLHQCNRLQCSSRSHDGVSTYASCAGCFCMFKTAGKRYSPDCRVCPGYRQIRIFTNHVSCLPSPALSGSVPASGIANVQCSSVMSASTSPVLPAAMPAWPGTVSRTGNRQHPGFVVCYPLLLPAYSTDVR